MCAGSRTGGDGLQKSCANCVLREGQEEVSKPDYIKEAAGPSGIKLRLIPLRRMHCAAFAQNKAGVGGKTNNV